MEDEKKYYEYTISIERANIVAMIMAVPVVLIMALPYYFIWHGNIFHALSSSWWIFLLSLPVGIILHEGLHGITWAIFAKGGFRSIKFGIKWEYFTPYCHCDKPLRVWQYFLGAVMPLVVMGIIPWILGTIIGNELVVFFAMFYTWAAGGDIQAIWVMRRFSANDLVSDHPEELGFIVYRRD